MLLSFNLTLVECKSKAPTGFVLDENVCFNLTLVECKL